MYRHRRKWRWSKFRMWEAAECHFGLLGWGHLRWRGDDELKNEFYLMCVDPEAWMKAVEARLEAKYNKKHGL